MQKLLQKYPKKIKLFLESIKSPETRRVYTTYFQKYLQYPGSVKIVEQTNARKIEDHIISFIISMKEQSKTFAAIHNYVSAIIKFYTVNDVVLNSTKIYRFMPDKKKSNKDRAYTHEEILQLLNVADERMKVMILLLSSTGMRIGAIPELKLRNLEKISMDSGPTLYKITVYENDKEEHFTYCTPECTKAIDNYLSMRSRYGEKISANSYLIRERTI
jgi:site-specific recombinase XerD